jgi:Ca2+-transporting ATPase
VSEKAKQPATDEVDSSGTPDWHILESDEDIARLDSRREGLGTLAVFAWQHFFRNADLTTTRTATLTTLVLFQKVHVFNCRSESESVFRKSPLSNKVLLLGATASLIVHIAALYIPWTQRLLSITPLDATTWLVALALALSIIIPNELHKLYVRRT